ncbi:MAG: hypothetical protein IJM64_02560 [Ottowia sp.]|nr:hypothetical protein [Ottowia sp.]
MLDTREQFCKPSEYAIKVDPVAEGTVTCPATVTAGGSVTCSVSLLAEGYEFDTLAVAGNATLGPCDANGCTLTGVMGALTVQGVFKAPPQPPQPQPQPVLPQPVLPQSPACAAAPSACSSAPTFGGAGLALAALALPAFAAPAFRRRKKTGKKADTKQ